MYRHWIAPMAVFFILWCRSGISILPKVPVAVPCGGLPARSNDVLAASSAQSCRRALNLLLLFFQKFDDDAQLPQMVHIVVEHSIDQETVRIIALKIGIVIRLGKKNILLVL